MSEKNGKGKTELGGGFDTNMCSSSWLHTDSFMLLFQFHVSNDKESYFYPRQKIYLNLKASLNISTLCVQILFDFMESV